MTKRPTNAIDIAEVVRIAHLARLTLTDAEVESLSHDLSGILSYVKKLEELDVTGVLPTSHATEVSTSLRDDVPVAGLSSPQALANAPEPIGGAFGVPKIIE